MTHNCKKQSGQLVLNVDFVLVVDVLKGHRGDDTHLVTFSKKQGEMTSRDFMRLRWLRRELTLQESLAAAPMEAGLLPPKLQRKSWMAFAKIELLAVMPWTTIQPFTAILSFRALSESKD